MASKTHAAELVDASITPGHLTGIFVTANAGDAMVELTEVMAIAETGLAGDRYANGTGFYSNTPTTPGARHVTLIADEDLTAAAADIGIAIGRGETRRNFTTEGVNLESLIGRRFVIGAAVLEGVRRCPPCVHLEEVTGKPLLKPLVRRGGLRARIVQSGVISTGDELVELGPSVGATDADAQ